MTLTHVFKFKVYLDHYHGVVVNEPKLLAGRQVSNKNAEINCVWRTDIW